MKVNDKTGLVGADATSTTKSIGKKTGSKANKSEGSEADRLGSAKIELSERAQDIKKIRNAMGSSPDVDEVKVAKFKNLIASGQYKVDAEKTADKMVDEMAYQSIFDE